MNIPGLKLLFLQSEIEKGKKRIERYKHLYDSCEIKNILLRRLIDVKKQEQELLEELIKGQRND